MSLYLSYSTIQCNVNNDSWEPQIPLTIALGLLCIGMHNYHLRLSVSDMDFNNFYVTFIACPCAGYINRQSFNCLCHLRTMPPSIAKGESNFTV